jgi:hypothetical protein
LEITGALVLLLREIAGGGSTCELILSTRGINSLGLAYVPKVASAKLLKARCKNDL